MPRDLHVHDVSWRFQSQHGWPDSGERDAAITHRVRWAQTIRPARSGSVSSAGPTPPVMMRAIRRDQSAAVTAFRYRGRGVKASCSCLDLCRPESHGTNTEGQPQQRMMQNRVDACRLSESPANAARGAPRGLNRVETKDFGSADQSDSGDNGAQSDGRSCVIHT
jgi:hypothetical protein